MPITGGYTAQQIDNLVELTLKNYRRDDWVDLSSELQQYFAMGTLLAGKKVGISGGEQLQWEIKLSNAGNARNTGLYASDTINTDMDVVNGKCPWAFADTHFAYDVREPDLQRGGVALIQKINMLRHGALTDMAKLMEMNFFSAPANNTDQAERLKPFGLLYWIVPNVTQGFNGGNPTGFSDCAGLDASQTRFQNWRNWTDTYKAVSFNDLIDRLKLAAYKTSFIAPIPFPEIGGGQTKFNVIMSTYTVVNEMESLLRSQNDNLGKDLAAMAGEVVFRGNPVRPIPYLDANSGSATALKQDPVILLNLSHFGCFFLQGQMMRRSEVTPGNQHNVRAVFFDTSAQYKCTSRRNQAFLFRN